MALSNNLIPVPVADTTKIIYKGSIDGRKEVFNGLYTLESGVWGALPANSGGLIYIGYDFSSQVNVDVVKVYGRRDFDGSLPKSFGIEGSDDKISWDSLGRVDGLTANSWIEDSYVKSCTLNRSKSYRYYRVSFNEHGVGGSIYSVNITEIEMFEVLVENKYLFKDGEEIKTWKSAGVKTQDEIPKMSSYTQGIVAIESSGEYNASTRAWTSFDDNKQSNGWKGAYGSSVGFLLVDFGVAKVAKKYVLHLDTSLEFQPRNWRFEGSNDKSNWAVLDTITNGTTALEWSKDLTYEIQNTEGYRYYRIYITATGGINKEPEITEMEIMCEDTPTWINVGSIAAKELFDLHGMSDLSLITNEAIQQLQSDQVELLCWTDEVSGLRNAIIGGLPTGQLMIGSQDMDSSEVKDILLKDISPYEKGVNLIPVMTGYNTPSGIVTAGSEYSSFGYLAWKAFNGETKTTDNDSWVANMKKSEWLAYEFNAEKKVNMYRIIPRSDAMNYAEPKKWIFEGWDGASWWLLDSREGIVGWGLQGKEFNFTNDRLYKKYRITILESQSEGAYPTIGDLQMYEASKRGEPVKIITSHDSGATWNGKTKVNITDLTSVKANGFTPEELNALTKEEIATLFPNGTARFAFYLEQENLTDVVEIQSLSVGEKQYTISPTATDISLVYEVLKEEKPTLYASRDDGVSWKEISQDEMASLSEQPEGNSLRVKAVLKNGQEIHALSYAWA